MAKHYILKEGDIVDFDLGKYEFNLHGGIKDGKLYIKIWNEEKQYSIFDMSLDLMPHCMI